MRARLLRTISAGLAIVLLSCCAQTVLVPIVVPMPALIDMREYTGLYFPGFVTEHAEFNAEIVRQLQLQFRQRGFTVVQGELSQWLPGRPFPFSNFSGQTALIVTGQLAFAPITQEGLRTRVQETFDRYGRRSVEETRRYVRESGWAVSGSLALLKRDRVIGSIPILGLVKQPVQWRRITVPEASYAFCTVELIPRLAAVILPRNLRTQRWLVK